MKYLPIILILCCYQPYYYCQGIDFFKEDIVFRIEKGHFYVEGNYWFANTTGAKLECGIYFPLSYSNQGSDVDSVSVYRIPKGEHLQIYELNNSGFSFKMELEAKDSSIYQIKYVQKIAGDSAMYVLRSTQSWSKPLKNAEYKLITGKAVVIKKFSYEPDKVYNLGGKKIYYWKRNTFMPERDMIFYFDK